MSISKFDGKWKLTNSDTANFEKYMAALGVGWATRKIGAKMGRTITFKATGDGSFHVISESTLKTNERDVKLNEEFEGERDDKAVLGNQIRYSTRSSVSDLIWSDQISVFEVLIRFQSENFIFFGNHQIRSDITKTLKTAFYLI